MVTIDSSNLIHEMGEKGITVQEVAFLLGETEETVTSRLTGTSEWIYEEVIRIRNEMFPEFELNYLFRFQKSQEAER